MEQKELKELLKSVASGKITVDEAITQFKIKPFEDLGFAKIDYHRSIRQGIAEVIYGAGKAPEHIVKIAENMLSNGQKTILITRMSKEAAELAEKELPFAY